MKRNHNAKEHVKLYKSKKNWVAATIFTTALGITGVSAVSNASANSVSSSSANTSSTSSSKVASSSVKPSNTVTLRSSSVANNAAVKSSSAQSSSVAAQKASLQNQINQKKQDLSNEQSQQSSLQNQYQKDSQAAQQASQNQASQINQVNQEASSKKQAAQNTVNNIQNNEVNSQKSSLQNQINNTQNDLNNTQNQINSDQSALQNKQNELNNLQNGGSTYNDSEGVVENVAHMNHNSHDYQRMFGPLYVTPDNDKSAVNQNDPLMKTLDIGFSPNLRKHDLINNNQPTKAQYKEICEALMAELNATREARGLQPFIMTDKMFNAVMERASQPSAQGENAWHDANGISKAFEDNGINFGGFRSECLAEYANLISPMKDVADLIYSKTYLDVYEWLDDDGSSNWGHRGNLLGNYNQPVQASFGLCWVPEDGDYNLVFDVANYNGDGSDNLMNQVKDWENQPANNNEAQIESLKNDINNLQNDLNNLNNQKQSLQNKINGLNNQMNNVQFDENQLSPSDKQAYDDAQNTLNTVDQWQQSQINSINNNSNVDALNKKANDDKAALDKLNNQIAQTKQEINDLENQLNALNNQPAVKPSTSAPAENKPVESPVVSTTVETKPTVSNDKKADDVLPGPDQIKVTPTISSENDKSSSNDANKVVANISYNKGIDPLTNQLLSGETPAQRQKAKNYVASLNKTAAVKENKGSEKPVYNQPITFTFSESKVKADNVKGNSAAKNELPTTGENQDKAATVLGIEAVSMGLALGGLSFLKRKKKH